MNIPTYDDFVKPPNPNKPMDYICKCPELDSCNNCKVDCNMSLHLRTVHHMTRALKKDKNG